MKKSMLWNFLIHNQKRREKLTSRIIIFNLRISSVSSLFFRPERLQNLLNMSMSTLKHKPLGTLKTTKRYPEWQIISRVNKWKASKSSNEQSRFLNFSSFLRCKVQTFIKTTKINLSLNPAPNKRYLHLQKNGISHPNQSLTKKEQLNCQN